MNRVGRRSGGNRWAKFDPVERLLARVDFDTDCWYWTGSLLRNGYGAVFSLHGKRELPHRAAYLLFIGPIPKGMQLDHLCRNRCCVNPGHLEPVTARENLMRGNGWSGRNARKAHCPKGHSYSPENTLMEGTTRRCRTCKNERAARYRSRKLYGHLDVEDARADLRLLEVEG